jgi:hypothetical protein
MSSHPDPCAATVAAIADFAATTGRARNGDLLTQIKHRFAVLTAGPQPVSVDGAALGHGLPARLITVPELTAILLHPATSYDARDAVWRHLLARARTGGDTWVVVAVNVAMPGLRTTVGRLARTYTGDVAASVVAEFVAALRTADPHPPQVLARLLNTTHSQARAALRAATPATSGEGVFAPRSVSPPTLFGHPDFVLARAVRLGILTVAEADLIGATRLEDVPVTDYAERHGVTVWAVYKRRSTAEARLVTALRDGTLSDCVREVVAEATLTTEPEQP